MRYVTLDLGSGGHVLRTPTCYNELNPTWDDQNTYHFATWPRLLATFRRREVIDSVRLQHLNLQVYDDGLVQQFRETHTGLRSKENIMARRLGLSALAFPRSRSYTILYLYTIYIYV